MKIVIGRPPLHPTGKTDFRKFAPVLEALKKARDKSVTVTCKTEIEAIELQKWALRYGEYRADSFAERHKQEARICIRNRARNGRIVTMWVLPWPPPKPEEQ